MAASGDGHVVAVPNCTFMGAGDANNSVEIAFNV